jgi:hypothetical protein
MDRPPNPYRAVCDKHHLWYDTRNQTGCVLCQRDAAIERERPAGRAAALIAALALCVVVALACFVRAGGRLSDFTDGAAQLSAVIQAKSGVLTEAGAGRGAHGDQSRPVLRVLFVGNSLTYTNNLPRMVAELARAASEEKVFAYGAVFAGGYSLREHIASHRVDTALGSGSWDFVVLQEQGELPGWRPARREREFFGPARQLDAMVQAAGAKTVFYMTYARAEGDPPIFKPDNYPAMQARVIDGYETIARELGAEVVPVGKAWLAAWRQYPKMRLWVADGMHPSVAGTYLAACVFYTHFYRHSPVGVSYTAGLAESDAMAIRGIAAEVMRQRIRRSERR